MTIGLLVVYIGIAAAILTGLTGFFTKRIENWLISFLQHFAGALFVFSGWVKAIDPLGTAYKMEQYFAEFESTFAETSMSFLSPMFAWLSGYVNGFSVFMIVLEIVLGIMLIIGSSRKLTSWLFFLIIVFFSFLTGFTFLTGYVPSEAVVIMQQNDITEKVLASSAELKMEEGWVPVDTINNNFFNFKSWGAYNKNNMKVTDCGCFGDFIKLEPRTSFFKDIFLLIPALIFLFFSGKMHQLFSSNTRTGIVAVSTVVILIYCFSNYVWDIPHIDFRPFKEGVNVYEQKEAEMEADQNREILFALRELSSGKTVEIASEVYLANLDKYADESQYEFIDQIQGAPAIPITKISDFGATDFEGNEIGDDLLQTEGYAFMIVAYSLYPDIDRRTITVKDTSFVRDTSVVGDSTIVQLVVDKIEDKTVTEESYTWKPDYLAKWTEKLNPVIDQAQKEGVNVFVLTQFATEAMIDDFRHQTQSAYPFYLADDILLKTIVRSNPGIVLMKDGTIIKKWHYRKLPSYDKIKTDYLQ